MVIFQILFCLLATALSAAPVVPVKLSVEFKKETLLEGQPLQGELTIQHAIDKEVDLTSAFLDGRLLALKYLKEENAAGGLKTTYSFQIPEKSGGLHILQPITIEVGGVKYKSPQMTYEVKGTTREQKTIPDAEEKLVFRLESFIEGKKVFYPRQRAVFGYRYIFNDSIELKQENLPLLEPKGFKKIGSEIVENSRRSNFGVREIKQKVEAETPGRYSIGPASAAGLPYKMTLFQTKEYYGNTVQAETPGLELEIKAFPEKGRPPSFNGAIGKDLSFRVVLQSFSDVNVGDKITISLEISGDGEVENAPMPDICCQPGFPGRFRQSDIPPAEIFKNGIKFSVIDLFPLSTAVKEIPSVEFSFFNPDTESYKTIKSSAIPIMVRPTAEGLLEVKETPAIEKTNQGTQTDWPELNAKPQAIDIQTIYPLTPDDLHNRFLGSLSTLWILLFVPLALFIQRDLKKRLAKRQERGVQKEGVDLWNEVDRLPEDSPLIYDKMAEVLRNVSSLSGRDSDELKQFLAKIDEERFGKMKKTPLSELKKEGKRIYLKIKEGHNE